MKRLVFAAAVMALSLPSVASADGYYLNMTELPGGKLSVSVNFPDYQFSFHGPLAASLDLSEPEAWVVLTGSMGEVANPQWDGTISGGSIDPVLGQTVTGAVAWREPASDPNNPTYNALVFGYAPSGYAAEHIYAYSDLTETDMLNQAFGVDILRTGCGLGGRSPCQLLGNGQTAVIPLFQSYTINSIGDFAVTFTDLGDVAGGAPEPASWALMFGGFGMAGAVLRRRRARVAA